MSYTERFTEAWALLGSIDPASHSTEQNTGYLSCANYHRVVVLIHCGVIGGDLDIDVEESVNTDGDDPASFDAGGKDVTKTGTTDNDTVSAIEIKGDEFDVDNARDCLNIEVTPGAAGIFGVQVWGLADYKPVPTTNLDSVTD